MDDLYGRNFPDHFGLARLENGGLKHEARQKPRQRVFEFLESVRNLYKSESL
jgi:hypothetical protein